MNQVAKNLLGEAESCQELRKGLVRLGKLLGQDTAPVDSGVGILEKHLREGAAEIVRLEQLLEYNNGRLEQLLGYNELENERRPI
jgi:hypothetical protein